MKKTHLTFIFLTLSIFAFLWDSGFDETLELESPGELAADSVSLPQRWTKLPQTEGQQPHALSSHNKTKNLAVELSGRLIVRRSDGLTFAPQKGNFDLGVLTYGKLSAEVNVVVEKGLWHVHLKAGETLCFYGFHMEDQSMPLPMFERKDNDFSVAQDWLDAELSQLSSFDSPPLLLSEIRIDGVELVHSKIPFPKKRNLDIEIVLEPQSQLEVLARESHQHLADVTLLLAAEPFDHPGQIFPKAVINDHANSPIQLEELSNQEWVYVGAPGYAWQLIALSPHENRKHRVLLEKGGTLSFTISDKPSSENIALVVYPENRWPNFHVGLSRHADQRLLLADEMSKPMIETLVGPGVNRFEGIRPGRYKIFLVTGERYHDKLVLAQERIEIVPGATTSFEFNMDGDRTAHGKRHASGHFFVKDREFKAALGSDQDWTVRICTEERAHTAEITKDPTIPNRWNWAVREIPYGLYSGELRSKNEPVKNQIWSWSVIVTKNAILESGNVFEPAPPVPSYESSFVKFEFTSKGEEVDIPSFFPFLVHHEGKIVEVYSGDEFETKIDPRAAATTPFRFRFRKLSSYQEIPDVVLHLRGGDETTIQIKLTPEK